MPFSFLLAPMAELSHRALRELMESFDTSGADEYFTEMISAGALVSGGPFEHWYADNGPRPEKLVYQVVGGDAGQLERALVLLDRKECLGIDINMGCSAPAITRTGAGVRWMADIDRAGALIHRLRPLTKRRLSVKLRTGLSDDFEYLVRFCRRLEEEGLDFITLHPRTAKEKFKRKARWNYVSALKKELRIPLAGNGDISSAEEMLSRSAECDAVMIGRLAIRQPWIFADLSRRAAPQQEICRRGAGGRSAAGRDAAGLDITGLGVPGPGVLSQDPPRPEVPACEVPTGDRPVREVPARELSGALVEETGLRFLELLSRYQPPEFHLSRARRFFGYFCDNLKWGTHVKNLLNRETDLSGIEKAWKAYFAGSRESADSVL